MNTARGSGSGGGALFDRSGFVGNSPPSLRTARAPSGSPGPATVTPARPAPPQRRAAAPPEVTRGGRRGLRSLFGQHPRRKNRARVFKRRTRDGRQARRSGTAESAAAARSPRSPVRGARRKRSREALRGRWPRRVGRRRRPRATHPGAGNAGSRPSGTRAVASSLPPQPGSSRTSRRGRNSREKTQCRARSWPRARPGLGRSPSAGAAASTRASARAEAASRGLAPAPRG